ncbi:MAG TPA: GNAT family N-acetyltransferase [Acidobacteriaceae bacterium]|nr:GNAT family N-acetyltransferase [Acidobacteriaceae bacterium]
MIRLETARFVLREMTLEDAPALFAVLGDAETMRWYPRAYTFEEVQEGIARQIERYPSGAGLLGLVLKESGILIGDCGVVWQEVEDVMEPEVGYHLRRDFWNLGLATEGARAVMTYAFMTLSCDRVISLIRPENVASRRVAEKNGLAVDRVVNWRGFDHCVYRAEKEQR